MSAPPPQQSAQQGQAKRRRPNRGPRKPKAPAAPGAPAAAAAAAQPPHLQATTNGAATPFSMASTVTTPSQTPRAATPIPGSALSKTFSSTRFADFVQQGLISQATARGIAQGGYEYCTEVQAQTLPVCLTGVDVCVHLLPLVPPISLSSCSSLESTVLTRSLLFCQQSRAGPHGHGQDARLPHPVDREPAARTDPAAQGRHLGPRPLADARARHPD